MGGNGKPRLIVGVKYSTLLRQFSETFRKYAWPGQRSPEVFHGVRSLELSSTSNACLPAKCVVVDEE
jgi:hypothetical protein